MNQAIATIKTRGPIGPLVVIDPGGVSAFGKWFQPGFPVACILASDAHISCWVRQGRAAFLVLCGAANPAAAAPHATLTHAAEKAVPKAAKSQPRRRKKRSLQRYALGDAPAAASPVYSDRSSAT